MILLGNELSPHKDVTILSCLDAFQAAIWCVYRDVELSLTYLGHSAICFEVKGINIYVDPYLNVPVDVSKLPKGHLVLLSHGHFDHGAQLAVDLYERWGCQFAGPPNLMKWMQKKFKSSIPKESFLSIEAGNSIYWGDVKIHAIPAHHPINRLGKTLMAIFARSKAPGKPVNGYYFEGYYHSGATIYTDKIQVALKDMSVHTACLPIGGKYATATPKEALEIAESIGARRLVPMHWQPLLDQVFFRYQPSDLLKLAKESGTPIDVKALAIGESLSLASLNETCGQV